MSFHQKFIAFSMLLTLLVPIEPACAGDDLDQRLSYAYLLTMDNIRKLESIRKEVSDWLDKNERISKKIEHDKDLEEGGIAERARAFDLKYPEIGAIIRKRGMSAREYVLASQVLFRTLLLVMKKREGEIKDYSQAGPGVNPANLAFVEEHLDEIRKAIQIRTKA